MIHKKGEILVLSTGEYSDYGIRTIARVLKRFDEQKVFNLYPDKKDKYDFEEDTFVAYLIKQKYVEEIDYIEWNFAQWGSFSTS